MKSQILCLGVSAAALLAVVLPWRPRVEPTHFRGTAEVKPFPLPVRGPKLRLVHIADLPSPGREAMFEAFVDEMAQVRPDAVLATGDIAYDTSEAWLTFIETQFARLEALGIHVLAVPGNHERKGWAPWLRRFGTVLNHRADLGDLTILSLDSGHGRDRFTPSQFQWLKAQLESAHGRTILIQVHHPIFPPGSALRGDGDKTGGSLQGFQPAFLRLCQKHKVELVLSGHWHQDAVFDEQGRLRDDRSDFPGTKFVVTTALGDSIRSVTRWPHSYFGYRLLEFERGRLVRYTHDPEGKGGHPPIFSTPLGTHAAPRPTQESPR